MKTLTVTPEQRIAIGAARRIEEIASEMRPTTSGDRVRLDINKYMSDVLVEIITGLRQDKE